MKQFEFHYQQADYLQHYNLISDFNHHFEV